MKKIFLLLTIATSCQLLSAQVTGTVQYTETRKLHINIQGDAPPPPDLPKEHSNKTVLFYNETASLYKNDTVNDENVNTDEENENGDHIIMRMTLPDNKVYCDFTNKKMIRQEDFMQRKFIVESDLNGVDWKLTGKQKMVLNFPCQEAVHSDSTETISVWFTSLIPVSSGPSKYAGLPGLVLEVNINNGDQIITATSINKETDLSAIKKPSEGKKVTEAEFNKIVADKLKEMGIDNPHGGATIMIRTDN